MPRRLRSLLTPAFVRIWWISFSAFGAGFLLYPSAPFRLRELGAPAAAQGWFLGGLTYGSALSAAWTGALGDVLGRRRVLVGAGTLLALLGLVYAVIPSWHLLVALAFPHGVFWSALLTANNAELIHELPAERRAEGIAYYGLAANLAIAVAPAVGIWALDKSWTGLCVAIAVLDFGVVMLSFRLPADPPWPRDLLHHLAPHRAVDRRTLVVAATLFLGSVGYGGLTSFVALFAESRGIAPRGIFFTAFAVTIIVVRPLVSPWIDRRGPRRVLPGALVLAVAGLAATALPTTRWQMIGAAVVYGFGFSLLSPAFTAWVMDNVDPDRRGAAYGATLAAFDLGIGSGSILLGVVAARIGYPAVFLVSAGLALFAWPYLLWAERRVGFVGHRAERRLDAAVS